MADTQWPTFEVFQQARPGEPHRNAGSVHAPDAEIALLNARDIFVRRPYCHSLWVVPAGEILAVTAQALEDGLWPQETAFPAARPEPEPYYVCQKLSQRPSETYVTCVGTVRARTPVEALRRAVETFNEGTPWVWWVFPARAVTRSEADDIASMFDPALDKPYRDQSYYRTVSTMRRIRQAGAAPHEDAL